MTFVRRITERAPPPAALVARLAGALRRQELTIFAGAGISANSGLPTATALIDRLLGALPLNDSERQLLSRAGLPFEACLQILTEGAPLDRLLQIYAGGSPTAIHSFVAKSVRRGYVRTICTTNFDLMIERALAAEQLHRSRDYTRMHRPADFARLSSPVDGRALIKLHGSVDHMDSLAATIRSVASRQFNPQQAKLLAELFGSYDRHGVLIMGYSGSDKFDIMPQLMAMRRPYAPVIVISHAQGVEVGSAVLVTKSALPESSPWRFLDSVLEVTVDTDLLVRDLWRQLLDEPYHFDHRHTRWTRRVTDWVSELEGMGASCPHRMVGRLFEETGDLSKAAQYLRRALVLEPTDDSLSYYKVHGDLGRVANLNGDYPAAILHGRRALMGAHKLGDMKGVAGQLGNLGLAYYNLGRSQRALRIHRRAWYLATRIGADQIRANELGNIGLVYRSLGRYRRAANCHLASIRGNREMGSVRQQAGQLANLGLCYRYMGDLAASEAQHKQALALYEKVGDFRRTAIEKGSLGVIHQRKSDYPNALRLFCEALSGARLGGDRRSMVNQLNGIAEVFLETGKPKRAAVFSARALALATELRHRYSEGMTNVTVGRACFALGERALARRHAEQAQRLLANLVPQDHPYRRAADELLTRT